MQTSNFPLLMTLYSNFKYFGNKTPSKLITFYLYYITGELKKGYTSKPFINNKSTATGYTFLHGFGVRPLYR